MSNSGVFNPSRKRAFTSTNDLSSSQFLGVALDGSNDNSVVLANAQTNVCIGILLNNPVAGDDAEVALLGPTTFGIAGGSITKGAKLTVDASGKLIATTTAADQVVGIAMEGASSGDRFEFMMVDMFYHA